MSAANGITEHVRRVTTTEGLDILKPLPFTNGNIDELLTFAHSLRDVGLDLGPRVDKIEQVWVAAQEALQFSVAAAVADIDIDTVQLDEIAGIVSRAATSYTSHLRTSFYDAAQDSGVQRVINEFDRALTKAAAELLRGDADRIVQTLRKDFDKAATAIVTAHKQGISRHTDRDQLLNSGSDTEIAAYRALPDAVQVLDRVAGLRLEMTRRIGYVPNLANAPHDVACFVTGIKDELELDGAENAWEGDTEHVQVDGYMNGSSIQRARIPRIGGAWLAIVQGGHRLHLNTAAEAAQVALANRVKVA